MATWAARASTKCSGQTSLTARWREVEGPSKSPPLLALVLPPPLPLPSSEEEEEEEEEDINKKGSYKVRRRNRREQGQKVKIKTQTEGPKWDVWDSSRIYTTIYIYIYDNVTSIYVTFGVYFAKD